jgi:hypothetical protein
MASENSTDPIRCPYCGTSNFISIQKNCLFFPYPRIFGFKDTYGSIVTDKIFFQLEKIGMIEKLVENNEIQCSNCKQFFSLTIFLKNETDPQYDDQFKNRMKFLSEKEELIETIPILERFLNWWFKGILPFKNRLFDSYFLLFLPLILFLIIPSSIEIFKDIPFLMLFVLFGLLIYFFNSFNEQFHKTLNISELPLDLNDNYKQSRFGHLFEVWKIKDTIYDFWTIPILNKKVHHATAYGVLTAIIYFIFYTLLVLIFHKNLFIGQSNFNFLLAIGYLPYWLIICFILGNILFLLLSTATVISELFEILPVKFDIMKNYGGFDSIVDLCNLIIFQISIIGIIAVVWIYGLITIKFIEINIPAFLSDPVGLFLILIILIFMLWMYIRPMLIIVKKYQKIRKDYIETLGNKINSFNPSTREYNFGELFNLQFKYNLAVSLPDWPTKIKIKVIIALIVPIISLIITAVK